MSDPEPADMTADKLMAALVEETAMVKALQKQRKQADDMGESDFVENLDAEIARRLDRMVAIVAEMKARTQTE